MEVVVVGGGLIGLASAWRAAEAGHAVTVVDEAPGSGASSVAAGMLAPVTEVTYGEEELLRLAIAGADAWPAFADDLTAASDQQVGYRPEGTLLVAHDDDDRRALAELAGFMGELGLEAEVLRSRACRQREPMLSPRIRGGVLAHGDHRVDPRRVLAALEVACQRAGAAVVRERVERIGHDDDRVTGVTLASGDVLQADTVVLAAGPWSGRITGLPEDVRPRVRPVKGQVVLVRTRAGEPPLLGATVRALVAGRSVYLVPRADGEVVIGATQEERGFDTEVTAGGVRELLDDAARVVPGIDEAVVSGTLAGLRPGTHDNRPLIGPTRLGGLLLATGHHRNGVLLTPITADAVAALLAGREPDPVLAVADPMRDGSMRGTSTRDGSARDGSARDDQARDDQGTGTR